MSELYSHCYRNVKDVQGNDFWFVEHVSICVTLCQLFSVHLRPEIVTCFVKCLLHRIWFLKRGVGTNFLPLFPERTKFLSSDHVYICVSSLNQLISFNKVQYEGLTTEGYLLLSAVPRSHTTSRTFY